MIYSHEFINRFWSKVDKKSEEECWLWKDAKNRNGYGRIIIWAGFRNYKDGFAHRVSWEIENNASVPKGMLICHTCDVRSCVNPKHLFSATHKENMEDMTKKGRAAKGDRHVSRLHPEVLRRGEKSHFAKFSDKEMIKILRELKETKQAGGTIGSIARKYKIGPDYLSNISKGRYRKGILDFV